MDEAARAIERELSALSGRLSPDAQAYWQRHQPRHRYLLELLGELRRTHAFPRILDVGMGFETLLLSRYFPASRVDCLGVEQDERFRPERDFTFIPVDLNLADAAELATRGEPYDLIVFMEVLEHLYTPPEIVLRYLGSRLATGGLLVITTPNAVWLKNRLKMLCGRNPFEKLRAPTSDMGHIREYTLAELRDAIAHAGLEPIELARHGLYRFDNAKDNFYSRLADLTHSSLRRTLVAVCRKP